MKFNLAIVGATGLVGRKFLEVLEESFLKKHIQNIYFFASAKSVGGRSIRLARQVFKESFFTAPPPKTRGI